MKQLVIGRDTTSLPTYGLPMTDSGYTARVAADTDTTLAVPAGAHWALLSGDDFFFVSAAVITLPTEGAGFSAANDEQAKEIVIVDGISTLHFRARNATDITVSFWR